MIKDDQLKVVLEEIKKPEVLESIVNELRVNHEKQLECHRTTGHKNQHIMSINYTRWRAHYICNDCRAVDNRPLNQKETAKYYRLMRTPITI